MHFYDLNINEVLYQVGHATDQKRHLVQLIRFRIFKMRWASVANDHLGPKPTNLRQRNPKESVNSPMSASGLG